MARLNYTKRGVVALISVIVIGAVGLSLTLAVVLSSISRSQTGQALERGVTAENYAASCAEIALNALRLEVTYGGNQTVSFPQGSCSIASLATAGDVRQIKATGIVGDTIKRIEVFTSKISPNVLISSWRVVTDFAP